MYPDPKRVKDNRITVRLDDYEEEKLQQLSIKTGEQPSTLLRKLFNKQLDIELAVNESMTAGAANRKPAIASTRADKRLPAFCCPQECTYA